MLTPSRGASALLASVATLVLAIALPASATATETEAGTGTETPTQVETIIVTGQRDPDDPAVVAEARARLARTPGAVAVVSAESYDARLAQGFFDTLRLVPGVLAQRRYGEEARLSIRGSGIGQGFHQRGLLLAQDGVPFADADGFGDFQGVDAQSARFIEVYKGGNTLRFGGAQLGGAINLITPTGRTALSDNLIRLEGGSFDTFRVRGEIARASGDWDLYAGLSVLSAEGWRPQSEQDQARLTVNLGRRFGEDRELRLLIQTADVQQNIPGSLTLTQALTTPRITLPVNIANDYSRDLTLARVSLQGRWRFNESTLVEGGVWRWTKQLYHPIFQVVDQDSETWGGFGRLDWEGRWLDRRADLFAGFSYRTGEVEALRYVNVAGQRGALTANGRQDASGLDLFAEGRLFVTDRLAVTAGGSLGQATRDYRDLINPANDDEIDYDWFAPRIGLLWEDDDGVQVFANVTRSVEPPTFGALAQAPLTGFTPVEVQDALTFEIGTRGRRGDLTWDVALYRAEIEGEMLTFITGPDIPAATFNADETLHQGLEAALDWRVPLNPDRGGLVVRQAWTYSDFRFENDPRWGDNQLPVVPEHQYRAEVKYTHPLGWFIAPSVEWRGGDTFVDYANRLEAPGYTVWSLNAGWSFDNGVSLFVDGRNLTDERYVAEVSAITDSALVGTSVFTPGEGRAVFVGVGYRF